jgi:hypothetical protein
VPSRDGLELVEWGFPYSGSLGESRQPVKPIRPDCESLIQVPERSECDGLHNISAQSLDVVRWPLAISACGPVAQRLEQGTSNSSLTSWAPTEAMSRRASPHGAFVSRD